MGPSMLPTFNVVGDFVALEHFSPRFRRLEVGDVIVCKSPTNPWRSVCKRIIGMVKFVLLNLVKIIILFLSFCQ